MEETLACETAADGPSSADDGAALPALTPAPSGREDPYWDAYWIAFFETYEFDLCRFAGALFRKGYARPQADDLAREAVQSFVTRLMTHGDLARMGEVLYPRALLRTLFGRHLVDMHRRSATVKRGGHHTQVSFEVDRLPLHEVPSTDGDDAAEWLPKAINDAVKQLAIRKRGRHAAIIRDMLLLNRGGRTSSDLPRRLGVGAKHLAQMKFRARQAFLQELLKVVRRLTPDLEIARRRCRWIARNVLPRPGPLPSAP